MQAPGARMAPTIHTSAWRQTGRENTGANGARIAIISGGRVSTDSSFGKRWGLAYSAFSVRTKWIKSSLEPPIAHAVPIPRSVNAPADRTTMVSQQQFCPSSAPLSTWLTRERVRQTIA